MNARKAIAAALMLAALPLVPACTRVTNGHADINASDFIAYADSEIEAKLSAERAPVVTPTTTASAPQLPSEYEGVAADIRSATAGVKAFWFSNKIDLRSTKVTMIDEASHAPCGVQSSTIEADGWMCRSGVPEVVLYLPMIKERAEIGGEAYSWFLVGHELGHVVDYQNGVTSTRGVAESFADCLSGAAAQGTGMGSKVMAAVRAVEPASTIRHESVQYGIDHGYRACIAGAK